MYSTCEHSGHNTVGIGFLAMLIDTSDVHFDFYVNEIVLLTLDGPMMNFIFFNIYIKYQK